MIGFYSAKADQENGHAVYLKPDGSTVKITVVSETKKWIEKNYKWDDTVCVGEVTTHILSNWHRERF